MDNNKEEKNLLRDERIDAYFRDEMTIEEESQFMKDVAADEDLRQKVVALARLAKGMQEVGKENDKVVRQALKSTSQERTEQIVAKAIGKEETIEENFRRTRNVAKYSRVKPEEKHLLEEALRMEKEGKSTGGYSLDMLSEEPKKRRWSLLVSIAASVAIVVCVGITFLQGPSTVELGERYSMTFESSTIRGAEDSGIGKQLIPMFEKVNQGKNLDVTISELTKLWALASKDEYNGYTEYAPEIGWNLTIAHLKNNDKSKAKEVLNQLIPLLEENSVLYNKALELKDKL